MRAGEHPFKAKFHTRKAEALFIIRSLSSHVVLGTAASYTVADAILLVLPFIALNSTLDQSAVDFERSRYVVRRSIGLCIPAMASRADALRGHKRASLRTRRMQTLGIHDIGFGKGR
jgi:hypothetical protein